MQRHKDAKTPSLLNSHFFAALRLGILALAMSVPAYSQKIALLTPEKNGTGEKFAEKLAEKLAASLSGGFKILDSSLSEAAFLSSNPEKPFNLTREEAKIIGEAIGCDVFLLVRAANLRRFSFEKKEYFEAYAAVYAVGARSGRLLHWKLATFNGYGPEAAEKLLLEAADNVAGELAERLPAKIKEEIGEKIPALEEPPAPDAPGAKNFRAPLPYRRISPSYTALAGLYSVAATVDAEVDFDENGKILRIEIVRWAGFGLDEAVAETVRKMNWRGATRDGKPLPVRILLRYNFRKIEKDE